MRLIDADAIHKFVEDKVAEGKDGWAKGVGYEWAWTLSAVDMQPTIDPESLRKKGKWKAYKPDCRGYTAGFICSCCGIVTYTDYSMKECDFNFCPNCGAKMDGERRED